MYEGRLQPELDESGEVEQPKKRYLLIIFSTFALAGLSGTFGWLLRTLGLGGVTDEQYQKLLEQFQQLGAAATAQAKAAQTPTPPNTATGTPTPPDTATPTRKPDIATPTATGQPDTATPTATRQPNTATPTGSPTATRKPDIATPTATGTPEATSVVENMMIYKEYETPEQVAAERGGNPQFWKKLVWRVGPVTVLTPDGKYQQLILDKGEWVYDLKSGGKMTDLKESYRIPQTLEEAAKLVNRGVDPQNPRRVRPQDVRLIKIFSKGNAHYADWMKQWLTVVPSDTAIGFEIIQNHGSSVIGYDITLPPGVVMEAYDDRETQPVGDDIAFVFWNYESQPVRLKISGATVWPWGNPNKLVLEQDQYAQAKNVSATYFQTFYLPQVAANFNVSETNVLKIVHYLVTVEGDGRVNIDRLNYNINKN